MLRRDVQIYTQATIGIEPAGMPTNALWRRVRSGAALYTCAWIPPIFASRVTVVHSAVTTFSPHRHDDPLACRRGRHFSRAKPGWRRRHEQNRPACRAGEVLFAPPTL